MEKKRERHFRIGEVAERTGLTVRALRWYDEVGLLVPPERSESGQRLYTEEELVDGTAIRAVSRSRIRFAFLFKIESFSTSTAVSLPSSE